MDAHWDDPRREVVTGPRRRWYHAPLLHFLAGGGALFLLTGGRPLVGASAPPVVVTATEVAQLRIDYERDTGLVATDADEAALVDKAIDDELLVREAHARGLASYDRSIRGWLVEQMEALGEQGDPEQLYARALALGLDRSDLVVRRILLHKMRLLLAKTDVTAPSETALQAFWALHREEYRAPDVTTFWHVFFSKAARGSSTADDARAALRTIEGGTSRPVDAVRLGDTFVTSAHVVGQAGAQTTKVFGPAFTASLATAPIGRWTGPVSSSFGEHLVLVESRVAGALPTLDAVRDRVAARWMDEQRRARLVALVERLRRRATLDVASDAWRRSRS